MLGQYFFAFLTLVVVQNLWAEEWCRVKPNIGVDINDRFLAIREKDDYRSSLITKIPPRTYFPCPSERSARGNWYYLESIDASGNAGKVYLNGSLERYVDKVKLPEKMHWNAPDTDKTSMTLFGAPGMSYKRYKEIGCVDSDSRPQCRRFWPPKDKNTTFQILDAKVVHHYDVLDHEFKDEAFYKVRVKYMDGLDRNRNELAWIPADMLREDPIKTVVKPAELVEKKCTSCRPQRDPLKDIKEFTHNLNSMMGVESDLQLEISKHVGKGMTCDLKEKAYRKDAKGNLKPKYPEGDNFNNYVVKHWVPKLNKSPLTLASLNGQPVTNHQLYAIDAVARTLYGEMRGCYKKGDQYAMAAARVMYNRAAFVQSKPPKRWGTFVKSRDSLSKGDRPLERVLPYVIGVDSQFSAWKHNDPNLDDMLCPSRDSEEWQKSVAIAMNMVLDTKKFREHTKGVKEFIYTSNMTFPFASQGYPEVDKYPMVYGFDEGITLSDDTCIRLWQSRGPAPLPKDQWKSSQKSKNFLDFFAFQFKNFMRISL